ncbi:unnamed protein product [Rotaria sp. Silwood2]|nr:unnamed protein product [Rotaria sp. Silwood2]CAF4322466.1 unnamed protein product [Rotaria sp. Silwood2]
MVSKCILKELKSIEDASRCYSATIVNDDIFHWEASIIGPDDSPYEGRVYRLDIRIPSNFPIKKILLAIISLLTDANSDDPYNARAALYYREDRQKFDEIARSWTKKYSM